MAEGKEKTVQLNESGQFAISFKDDFIRLLEITSHGDLIPDFTATFQRFDGVEYITEGYLHDRGNSLYPKAPAPYSRNYLIEIDLAERTDKPKRKSYFRNHQKNN
ncbi:MAG: hypothetical protein P1U89_26090 [Verrucomicrobiales bacterium]|nr:hypothetical protein [Verrucomicrobiales bacterium]